MPWRDVERWIYGWSCHRLPARLRDGDGAGGELWDQPADGLQMDREVRAGWTGRTGGSVASAAWASAHDARGRDCRLAERAASLPEMECREAGDLVDAPRRAGAGPDAAYRDPAARRVPPRPGVAARAAVCPARARAHAADGAQCPVDDGFQRAFSDRRCPALLSPHAPGWLQSVCVAVRRAALESIVATRPSFARAFAEYGLPVRMRMDNGRPFTGTGLAHLTQLSVWWLRLGIQLERIRPGHPEENGSHEQFHGELKRHTARPPAATLRAQQRRFDTFCYDYNHERPHDALAGDVPARHYLASARSLPARLPPLGYPDTLKSDGWLATGWCRGAGARCLSAKPSAASRSASKRSMTRSGPAGWEMCG